MKLHLAIDENSKEIEASTLTDHLTSDASQVKPLLDNVDAEIGDVKADGAYDYDSVLQVGIGAQMPFFIVHKIRNPQSIVRKITKMLKTFERLLILSKVFVGPLFKKQD